MNQMMKIDNSQALTMSSREIAQLTGKRHDNVMRDARVMLAELHGEGGVLKFEDTQRNPQNGQSYPIFRLPKRETLILVSGYNLQMRAAIIDRWQELEAQPVSNPYQLPDFNNPAVAARAWADAIEQKQQLALENQQVRQDLEHLQAHFTDGMRITDFARTLNGVNCQQVQNCLADMGWIRRDGFGWRVNSQYRDRYLAERPRTWRHPITEEQQESHYPVLLKKGAVRMFKLYTDGKLPMKTNWNGKYGHGSEVMQ